MGRNSGRGGKREQRWKEKAKSKGESSMTDLEASSTGVASGIESLHISGNRGLVGNVKAESVDVQIDSSSCVGSISQALDGSGGVYVSSHPTVSLSPNQFGGAWLQGAKAQRWVEKPKGFATNRGIGIAEAGKAVAKEVLDTKVANTKETSSDNGNSGLTDIFHSKAPNIRHPLGVDFNVDKNTYSEATIRATFYPKFENEKSDQEDKNDRGGL